MKVSTPSKVIIMRRLKYLALTVSEKKAKLKLPQNEEICALSPLCHVLVWANKGSRKRAVWGARVIQLP